MASTKCVSTLHFLQTPISDGVDSKRIPIVRSMAAVVLVPKAGLEPARLAAGDFESPASTYFATWAGVLFFIVWSVWSDLNRQSLASEASGLTRFSHTQMILFKPSFVSVRSDFLKMVGVKGFEPSTPCTPCKCATKLRYTPN